MRFPYHGAGIGLVFNDKILIGKRSKSPFIGFWAVPGGGREVYDKDELENATRELREETGIELSKLGAKRICSWTLKIPFFSWTTFYFLVKSDDLKIKVDEFSLLEWVNIKDVKKMHLRPFMAAEVRFLTKYLRKMQAQS